MKLWGLWVGEAVEFNVYKPLTCWLNSSKAARYVGLPVLWLSTGVPFSPRSVSSCWRTQGTTFQSPPFAWFQTVFPGKLLCLTSSISHAQEVHISLPLVSLVWSVLIQFITSVSSFPPSTYIKTSINVTRWTSCACYPMCSDVLPRAVGIGSQDSMLSQMLNWCCPKIVMSKGETPILY
jgi:hypothetical protein